MRIRQRALRSAVLALAAAWGVGSACPRGHGVVTNPCSTDQDCGNGYLCHPIGLVCVKTCSVNSDCPSNAANCAPVHLPDGGATESICKCQTDLLCGIGSVCNINVDDQCEGTCMVNLDCAGFGNHRKCETATGKCVLMTCIDDPTLCPDGMVCDPLQRICVVPDGG